MDDDEAENLPELEKWGIFLKVGNDIEKRDLLNRLMASSEGIREGKMEDARGMKAENIPLETIVKITGFTPEQVAAL